MKYAWWQDSNLFFSLDGYRDGLFDGVGVPAKTAVSDGSIGFQNHTQRFFQILLGFRQSFALSVYTGNLFDVSDIPFAVFNVDRCELSNHKRKLYLRNAGLSRAKKMITQILRKITQIAQALICVIPFDF